MLTRAARYASVRLGTVVVIVVVVQLALCGIGKAQPYQQQPPTAIDISQSDDIDRRPFLEYVRQQGQSPIEYVVNKFTRHDVVLLGEMHEVRENCELISALIEPLYRRAGVTCLVTEFLKHKDTALANKLVTAKQYDQELALRLFRDLPQPAWGFKEYMDIIRAIWTVNSKLPPEATRFRIVGMDMEWDASDLFRDSPKASAARRAVGQRRDPYMAKVVVDEVLTKSSKALIHAGYMHTLTFDRMGGILYQKYSDRVFQICLHHRHSGLEAAGGKRTKPVIVGFIEELMSRNGDKPVGFDVVHSPFAHLRDRNSFLFTLKGGRLSFSDIAQGYIFLKPLNKLRKITWVKGFVDKSNFERCRVIAEKRGWIALAKKHGILSHSEADTPEGLNKLFEWLFSFRLRA